MSDTVLLVRHTEVARAWHGRCYGASDVPLSRDGVAAMTALATDLAARYPAWVVHSGLSRTRRLADCVARLARCPVQNDRDWRERDFGAWEGQSWAAIYRATGNAMDGMIGAPATFRPGGGETTCDLADRVTQAWHRLPDGNGIVVTHGGPIAALRGRCLKIPVEDWAELIPSNGAHVTFSRFSETG